MLKIIYFTQIIQDVHVSGMYTFTEYGTNSTCIKTEKFTHLSYGEQHKLNTDMHELHYNPHVHTFTTFGKCSKVKPSLERPLPLQAS